MDLINKLQTLKDHGFSTWNYSLLKNDNEFLVVVTNVEEVDNQQHLNTILKETKIGLNNIGVKMNFVISPSVYVSPTLTKGYILINVL